MAQHLQVVVLLLLALVPLVAARTRVPIIPRRAWVSFAAGVPMAFVFIELLPALSEAAGDEGPARFLPYLAALGGLTLYYGAESVVRRHRRRSDPIARRRAFHVAIGAYALLNLVIGYVLVEEERQPGSLAVFTLALALKFVVADHGLYEDHQARYDRVGRWVLAAALLVGGSLALAGGLPTPVVDGLLAFLAGAILLVVVKEELPAERESRWSAFVLGALVYVALVFAAETLAR